MRFQKQLFSHNPPHSYGDCQRTVFACLLDMKPEDIPNFGIHIGNAAAWDIAVDDFLVSQNLYFTRVYYSGDIGLEAVLRTQKLTNPGMYYMLVGESRNGVNHVVIGLNDKIIHDPSIDNSGIVGPCTGEVEADRMYCVEFLVPLFMRAGM